MARPDYKTVQGMPKEECLALLNRYLDLIAGSGLSQDAALAILELPSIKPHDRKSKVLEALAFTRGVLLGCGAYTSAELADHLSDGLIL